VAVHADQRGQVVQDVAAGRRVHVDGEHLLLHEVPRRPAAVPAVGGVDLMVEGAGAHGAVGGGQGVVDAVDAQPVVGGAVADHVAGHGLEVQVEAVGRGPSRRAGVGLVVLDVETGGGGVELGELRVVGLGHGA